MRAGFGRGATPIGFSAPMLRPHGERMHFMQDLSHAHLAHKRAYEGSAPWCVRVHSSNAITTLEPLVVSLKPVVSSENTSCIATACGR